MQRWRGQHVIDKLYVGSGGAAPATTDSAALGTTSLMFSDLFLASGAVINFNAGDVTMTHSGGKVTVASTWSTTNRTGRPLGVVLTIENATLLGNYANALKGYVDCEESGGIGAGTVGLLSAVNCEIGMPNGTCRGAYYPLEIEYVDQVSTSFGAPGTGSDAGFIYLAASGEVTNFDTDGVFMSVNGLGAASGKLLSADSQTLKVDFDGGGTTRYMVLSAAENGLYLTHTDTAGGGLGVKVETLLTATAEVGGRPVEAQVTYTPATPGSGGAVPVAVYAKTILTTGVTSTSFMWGVQAQLSLEGTAEIAGSQVAALRAVLTATATPTITSGNLANIYCDNLIPTALDAGAGFMDMIRLANHGGAIDSMISFYTPNVTALFRFESDTALFTNITGGGVHGGTIHKIKVLFEGATYYLIMSTAPS